MFWTINTRLLQYNSLVKSTIVKAEGICSYTESLQGLYCCIVTNEPLNISDMNIEELKKRPQFKDCVTEADVLARLDQLETAAGRADSIGKENDRLKAKLKDFEDAAEAAAAAARKALLDAAEKDGRINAETRPVYENLLKEHPEDGKKALAALPTKKMVRDTLQGGNPGNESPWEKRQREIRDKYHGK